MQSASTADSSAIMLFGEDIVTGLFHKQGKWNANFGKYERKQVPAVQELDKEDYLKEKLISFAVVLIPTAALGGCIVVIPFRYPE